jgi:nucleotide-binding universal stress UspA family protein
VAEQPHGQLAADVRPPIAATASSAGGTALIVDATPAIYAETKEQAMERVKAELASYLTEVAKSLPPDARYTVETMLDGDVKSAIVRFAMERQVDLIVMATHGRTGLVHVLCGDVAESVLRAGVAPVLLVHPHEITQSRQQASGTGQTRSAPAT